MKKTILTTALIAFAFAPISALADNSYPQIDKNIVMFETDATFNFTFDGDIILEGSIEEAKAKVAELAVYLTENPQRTIRIEGFTDETGTKLYNLDLSSRRVNGVKDMLIEEGVSDEQIIAVPYGELNEIADGHSDEAWLANRRIRIRLVAL